MPSPATTVIKIGGALLADGLPDAFWTSVRTLHERGPVVIVHGGGPQLTRLARRLGHEPRMVHGRRVTTDTDLDIVLWTLRGSLNARLVAEASAHGLRAVGTSGADGGTLRVVKRPPWTVDGETVDFGWVGDVDRVDPGLLEHLLEAGFLPVVAPVGLDEQGQLYNVNADTVSCALAGALHAETYLLVTESGGVRRAADDPSTRLAACDAGTFARGRDEGWIAGGMRVKLTVAFDALDKGVGDVAIVAPDDLADRSRGTRVVR